jgi:hypothetical protein
MFAFVADRSFYRMAPTLLRALLPLLPEDSLAHGDPPRDQPSPAVLAALATAPRTPGMLALDGAARARWQVVGAARGVPAQGERIHGYPPRVGADLSR